LCAPLTFPIQISVHNIEYIKNKSHMFYNISSYYKLITNNSIPTVF